MIIDGLVLATLLLSALIAFFRGFVREVLTLAGLGGALAAAYFLSPLVQPLAHSLVGGDPDHRLFGILPVGVAADVGAFAVIFLVVLIGLTLLAHAISQGLHAVGLGALDRTLGVLFGLIRAGVLILIVYLPFYFTAGPVQKESWFKSSVTLPIIDVAAQFVEPYLPRRAEDKAKDLANDKDDTREQGFDRLDGLMKQALDPDKAPDIIEDDKTEKGYTPDQNDKMDQVIDKAERP